MSERVLKFKIKEGEIDNECIYITENDSDLCHLNIFDFCWQLSHKSQLDSSHLHLHGLVQYSMIT